MSENKGDNYPIEIRNQNENVVLREEFNQIKEKIEFPDPNKPKIEITSFGLDQLQVFNEGLDSFKGESREKGVYAIVRCWNKNKEASVKINKKGEKFLVPGLRDLLENFKRFKENIPELKGVFLVISGEGEKEDKTSKNLQELWEEGKNEFPIIPLKVNQYSWTSGLNAPIAVCKELIEKKNIDPKKVMIMPYSFDVSVADTEIKKMKELIDSNHRFFLTFRLDKGGEHPLATLVDRETYDTADPTTKELKEKYKELLNETPNVRVGNLVSTNRNTLNLIPADLLFDYGGINPLANGKYNMVEKTVGNNLGSGKLKPRLTSIQGMEDIELFYRINLNAAKWYRSKDTALRAKGQRVLVDFYKSLLHPIYYTDVSWENRPQGDMINKIADEATAFNNIINGYSTDVTVSMDRENSDKYTKIRLGPNMEVPEEIQDFKI